ncbi:transcription factor [Apophysomyces sp. BC1015]|nr:transcription factor [Apophysomyces sp. BC1015]
MLSDSSPSLSNDSAALRRLTPRSNLNFYQMDELSRDSSDDKRHGYLPSIPVVMRRPYIVGSVKQLRSGDQQQQLQHHIVSESFIPMSPNLARQPRKRRRPPFSYSSLIAQAILESENERMTLRGIYSWIEKKYPALYNAEDTGWQVKIALVRACAPVN